MLIYLDANIVQYCADYEDFLFRNQPAPQGLNSNLVRELEALRELIHLEQFGDWQFAASERLLQELHRGCPTREQLDVYRLLEDSATWHPPTPAAVEANVQRLMNLNLRDTADRRHLATALAMRASWFLTNDRNVLATTKGRIGTLRVARPSQCVGDIAVGLYLKT